VGLDKGGAAAMERRRAGRATERVVAATAIALAGIFVALTVLAVAVPPTPGLGPWLPVHLLLAGAATTAIAGVMPFFSAAITNAPPAPGRLRFSAVVGVALGAAFVVLGRIASPALVGGAAWLAGAGGVVYIGGLALVGAATLLPLRLALGARRIVIGFIYGMAVVNVVLGATLASLLLLGWMPVVADWSALKPAHAWLNVFGFVSLVIAGTLLHLLPTVIGTRISDSRATVVTYAGVAIGPPIAALGFLLSVDVIALAGAAVLVVGAVALAVYAWDVVQRGGHWTTDALWHRFSSWSLLAGIGWFIVGAALAAWMVFEGGADAAGWQLGPLIAPLFIGWVGQVLVGAWSHLVPSVGPGLQQRHARQRRILGRAATPRLVLLNAGVAVMVVGGLPGLSVLFVAGLAGVVLAALIAVVLLVASLAARD
jgi:nitrite reductase (NO-forming)